MKRKMKIGVGVAAGAVVLAAAGVGVALAGPNEQDVTGAAPTTPAPRPSKRYRAAPRAG
jgi:hypothetical protein